MAEFELIDRLVSRVRKYSGPDNSSCVVDIGDDAAVLDLPPGRQWVISTDTLNSDVHFASGTPAHAIGHKSLAVNLSDLAAMGAEPAWFFLAISLPSNDPAWVDSFAKGMGELAGRAGITLAGGDTTYGPLSINVTVIGWVEPGRSLSRAGATEGDLVVVSGQPGHASRALAHQKAKSPIGETDLNALQYPEPRLDLARLLRDHASACIDVSDGLLADLGHILQHSGVGAQVYLPQLPQGDDLAMEHVLNGGDDYELCFCLPPEYSNRLSSWSEQLALQLTVIGEITRGCDLRVLDADGQWVDVMRAGFEHFSSAESS